MKTKNQVPQDDSISVAGIQFEQAEGNREANLSQATEIIAAHSGHDIYVLPELPSSGYGTRAFQSLVELAEPVDGPSYQQLSALIRKGFFQLGTRQR